MFLGLSQKKQYSNWFKLLILFIVVNLIAVACSSGTVIRSRPEGAEVYIDNVRQGVTPVRYSDTAAAGSTKQLVLKKEGYRDFCTVIRKSEFDVGPCIGGVLVLFPFVWVLGYPDTHEFELEIDALLDTSKSEAAPLDTSKSEAKMFIIANYKDLIEELQTTQGHYLSCLLDLLRVAEEHQADAVKGIKAWAEATKDMPTLFAKSVVKNYMDYRK
jgi:hypothetical protein